MDENNEAEYVFEYAHEEIWVAAVASLPQIAKSLKIANGIAIAKEMHEVGVMNDETYSKWLEQVFTESGYELKKK